MSWDASLRLGSLSPLLLVSALYGSETGARPAPEPPAETATAVAATESHDDPAAQALRHFNAGRELVDAGKLPEGLLELQKAHALPAVEPPETDFYLGMTYDSLHRLDPAILAYRRYVTRFPDTLNGRNVKERLAILELRRSPSAGPLVDVAPPARPPTAATKLASATAPPPATTTQAPTSPRPDPPRAAQGTTPAKAPRQVAASEPARPTTRDRPLGKTAKSTP